MAQQRARCTLQEVDDNADGNTDRLVMENAYLRLVLSPAKGGQCTSLVYKQTGKELTLPNNGILLDQEWGTAQWPSDFQQQRYSYQVINDAPKQLSVALTGRGLTGNLFFIEITKTITIFEERNGIRVDYRIHNIPDSQTTLRYKAWLHNVIDLKGEATHYYIPTTDGIARERGGAIPKRLDRWFYNASRPWSGMLAESGAGAVAIVEYSRLKCFYNWFADNGNTLEWRYLPVDIPAGGNWQTTFWLIPFSGLRSLEGASESIVGSLEVKDNYAAREKIPIGIAVYATGRHQAQAQLRVRRLPLTEWQTIGREGLALAPDSVGKASFQFEPKGEGTHVINARVFEGTVLLGEFEKPVVVGQASVAYQQQPAEQRIDIERQEEGTRVSLDVRGTVVTPHTKWAKPFHQGKTRALFLVELWGQREVVELAQRMELDYTVPTLLPTSSPTHALITPWQKIISREQGFQLAEKALDESCEVIVVADSYSDRTARVVFDWGRFTQATWAKILKQVEAGAGLVIVNPYHESNWNCLSAGMRKALAREVCPPADHGSFLTAGVPFAALDSLDEKAVRARSFGKGRIVALDYNAVYLTPARWRFQYDFRYWEYYYSLLAKCILWAGSKEPSVRVDALNASHEPGGVKVVVSLSNQAEEMPLVISATVHDGSGEKGIVGGATWMLPRGETPCRFVVPGDPVTGTHFVDVRLLNKEGKVIDWGSTSLRVAHNARIAEVTLNKESYGLADMLDGRVVLAGKDVAEKNLQLVVELIDNYGRIEARLTRDTRQAKTMDFQFTLEQPLTLIQRVRCELRDGERLLGVEQKTFYVPEVNRLKDGFFAKVWLDDGQDPDSYLATQRIERLRDLGFEMINGSDARSRPGRKARLRAEANVQVSLENMTSDLPIRMGHTERFAAVKKDNIRRRCFSDPEYLAEFKGRIQDIVRKVALYNPEVYSLEDEPGEALAQFDICYSEYCLKRFRKWLQADYKSIEALNREWETTFRSWDEVRPMTRQEVRGRKSYAPWADHHAFMDTVYAETMGLCRRWIEEIDPTAHVGVSGIRPAPCHYGFWGDWWKLMQEITYLDLYGARIFESEIIKSFAPKVKVARFVGYGRNEVIENCDVWRMLLCGQNGISFFCDRYLVLPDLSYSYFAEFMQKIIAELCHSGTGDLLASSERQIAPIAIHYSEASARAAFITGKQALFEANLFKWLENIKAIGLQARFVSYAQIENGELERAGYRALILPYSLALSEAEVTRIQAFAAGGGLVIGDVQAGLMDAHCKPVSKGRLDDLFGITRQHSMVESRAVNIIPQRSWRGRTINVKKITASFVEKGVKPNQATPLGSNKAKAVKFGGLTFSQSSKTDVSLLLAHEYGKGQAVYLGALGTSFMAEDRRANLLEDLFAWAEIVAPVTVYDQGGQRQYNYEVTVFRNGTVDYVGIMPDISLASGVNLALATPSEMAEKAKEIELRFGKRSHLYNVRTKKYIGFVDRVMTRAVPGVAQLYAQMPSRIDLLKLSAAARANRGVAFTFSGEIAPIGVDTEYVVDIGVRNPQGQALRYYGKRLKAPAGRFRGSVPLALNDLPGPWHLTVTEVSSGVKAEHAFVVE